MCQWKLPWRYDARSAFDFAGSRVMVWISGRRCSPVGTTATSPSSRLRSISASSSMCTSGYTTTPCSASASRSSPAAGGPASSMPIIALDMCTRMASSSSGSKVLVRRNGMRIGLTGGASNLDKLIEQARRSEADGFTSLWYASVVLGDPLAPLAIVGRETERIELGTAVLQTYPWHPLLQANRAASVASAMGRAGFTLGIGPSHEPLVRDVYGLSYDRPGRNTEEYVRILTAAL